MLRFLMLVACAMQLSTAARAGDCPSCTLKVVRDGWATCVPAPAGRVFSPYLLF